ncbi:hypothetical protein E2C01_040144 [Portunus trituberculatus]|uniref:Uncharacterized protein n=1 Tax=Portunus trituberculatus TaxID=210409 RepID=A0A5B7FPX2_PORTR|nr:hypothetical protein [Portunus trituberculatus]
MEDTDLLNEKEKKDQFLAKEKTSQGQSDVVMVKRIFSIMREVRRDINSHIHIHDGEEQGVPPRVTGQPLQCAGFD